MSFSGGIKTGGGFWNNVNATIKGVVFTDKAPGSSEAGDYIYGRLIVKVDDQAKESDQHLFVGGAERYAIGAKGVELTTHDGSPVTLGATAPLAIFVASLIKAGYDESKLPDLEAGEPLNLSCLAGERVTLAQEVDEKGTKKRGKRVDPKTKREYDRTNTVVSAYLGAPKGAGKPSKANGRMKATDIAGPAEQALTGVLEAEGGSLAKSRLRIKVFKSLDGNPLQQEITDYLMQDANLKALETISYDGTTLELVG